MINIQGQAKVGLQLGAQKTVYSRIAVYELLHYVPYEQLGASSGPALTMAGCDLAGPGMCYNRVRPCAVRFGGCISFSQYLIQDLRLCFGDILHPLHG